MPRLKSKLKRCFTALDCLKLAIEWGEMLYDIKVKEGDDRQAYIIKKDVMKIKEWVGDED